MIECMPSKVYGSSITLNENSFVRKIEDSEKIPRREELRTKISDVKVGETCCVEAIILKKPERREIQTKTGENVVFYIQHNLCQYTKFNEY